MSILTFQSIKSVCPLHDLETNTTLRPAASPTYVKDVFPSERDPRSLIAHTYRRISHIPGDGISTKETVCFILIMTANNESSSVMPGRLVLSYSKNTLNTSILRVLGSVSTRSVPVLGFLNPSSSVAHIKSIGTPTEASTLSTFLCTSSFVTFFVTMPF